MLVPLNIRKKVFGVLAVSVLDGDVRFSEKDLYYMSFMTNKAAYAIENIALYENIYENLFATLYAFVGAIEARDPYTEQHSNRVTRIAMTLCQAMGGSQEEQDILNVAGQLHDIGKIGIRDDILLKPGRLTDDEFGRISAPTLVVVTELDNWHAGPSVSMAREVCNRIPSAQLKIIEGFRWVSLPSSTFWTVTDISPFLSVNLTALEMRL